LSPAEYASELVKYAKAMKAVDPSIKIGAVLTTAAPWPDSVVASGDSMDWNQTVLKDAGSAIDFAIVHFYPPAGQGAAVLNDPEQLPGELVQVRSEIDQYAGPNGPSIGIAMTETDSNNFMDTQPGALYTAGHVPDVAGKRRVQRGLLEHAQRRRHDLHRAGRRDRLRRRGHPVQRRVLRQQLRAGVEHAVPELLRAAHAQQARHRR